jgi:prepilin-type processing-associated H-X9-DG protein
MNAALGGLALRSIRDPASTVLLLECVTVATPAGGPEYLTDPPYFKGGHAILFVDGHAAIVPPEEIAALSWSP